MCNREDTLAHNLGALYFDDVMSYNLLTAIHWVGIPPEQSPWNEKAQKKTRNVQVETTI